MYRRLEAVGVRFLERFVPSVEAEAACGTPYRKQWSSCWQCERPCGRWAPCVAECRSGCGCQVLACDC